VTHLKRNLLITALILFAGAAIGLLVPIAMAEKTSGVQINQAQLEQNIQQQYKKDLIVTQIEQYEAEQITKLKANYARTYGTAQPMPEIPTLTNQEKEALAETIAASGDQPAQIKDPWLQKVINEKRNLINEQDLAAGSKIYNQLDTGYLFGLADSGLTSEEKGQAANYLQSNLSGQDYDQAMQLYMEYAALMN